MTIREGPLLMAEILLLQEIRTKVGIDIFPAQIQLMALRLEGDPVENLARLRAMTWPEFKALATEVFQRLSAMLKDEIAGADEWSTPFPTKSH